MGRPRTLPTRPAPRTDLGESFAGYLDRLAARIGVPLLTVLARTGLVDEEHHRSLPVGYGVALPAKRLGMFCRVTRLPEEAVSGMLLVRYGGVACDFSGLDALDPNSFPRVAAREWAYFVGSHVCPACVMESGGVWKLAWRLPWSFACVRHRTLLVDVCLGCGNRVGAGRTDGRSAPAFPTRVPNPTLCRNALPKGRAAQGRAAVPCGHPLDAADALSLRGWPRLLATQGSIDGALAGVPCAVGGEVVASLDYFRDLRSVTALALSWGTVEDLGELPRFVRDAFVRHAEERELVQRVRARGMAAGEDGRTGPRSRHYTGPPHDAALMAAVLPLAVSVLGGGSRESLSEGLEPMVLRVREHTADARHRLGYFGFSSRLEGAADGCLEPHRRMVHRAGWSKASTEPEGVSPAHDTLENGVVGSDHVPQLFWEDAFRRDFSGMFPGIRDANARLFCSLALAKMVEGLTWEEAAERLGLPERRHNSPGNRAVTLLNATGNVDMFTGRLREVAARLAEEPDRVDYGLRRRRFANFTDIAPEDWGGICAAAGASPGNRGGRSRYAAAWVWCDLTGGDHRLAPGLRGGNEESRREVYRRFVKHDLPDLENHLAEYGQSLLERHEDDSDGGRGESVTDG